MTRERELLNECITYIWEHIGSYSDTIDTFKKLGFTEKELVGYGLRDYNYEIVSKGIDELQSNLQFKEDKRKGVSGK